VQFRSDSTSICIAKLVRLSLEPEGLEKDMDVLNNVLRRLHILFRNCLNFQSISPQLRQHNLLTDHEWQVIKNKDSHEDQVDEFLQYLPHKGKNCLKQLIECLELSLDHAGHYDLLVELKKEVCLSYGGHEICQVCRCMLLNCYLVAIKKKA